MLIGGDATIAPVPAGAATMPAVGVGNQPQDVAVDAATDTIYVVN